MKLTTDQLKKIIKEELKNVLHEEKEWWEKEVGKDIPYEQGIRIPRSTKDSSPRYSNSYIAKLKRELTAKLSARDAEEQIMDMYGKNPEHFESHPYPRLRTDAEHDKFQRDLKQLDQRADDDLGRPWWKKMLGMDE